MLLDIVQTNRGLEKRTNDCSLEFIISQFWTNQFSYKHNILLSIFARDN